MLFDPRGNLLVQSQPPFPRATEMVTLRAENGQPVSYPRMAWCHYIARAIIASTDVGLRFRMVHQGKVDELVRLLNTKVKFDIPLDGDEMRWIFWRLFVSLPPAQQAGVAPYWEEKFFGEDPSWQERAAWDRNPVETESLPEAQKVDRRYWR